VGNFKVKVRKKARFVDVAKCTGCGVCWNNCPRVVAPEERVIKKGDTIAKTVLRPGTQPVAEAAHG